jgi:formamidopyrimidine-DNA glycosylase
MPELPEVETITRDVRPQLEGRRITKVEVLKPDILKKRISKPEFIRGLTGRTIERVWRRAKNVVLDLDSGDRVVIQPGMTGSMVIGGEADYDVIRLHLGGRVVARYQDVRRLGRVYLLHPDAWERHDTAIGPEPLDRSFTAAVMLNRLAGRQTPVKKALMDQKRLAGVGNIYASEALWIAGIDPSRPAASVTAQEAARLRDAIVDVLRRSIRGRGTTVRDYRTGTGEPGNFAGRLAVYERAGEPCLRCGASIAGTHSIDARSTYFCYRCQR